MLPVASDPIRDGAVAFRDGVIVACGSGDELAGQHPELPERFLGETAIVVPGFVDAHCHLEWSLFDGLLPEGPFSEWLAAMIPIRGRLPEGGSRVSARLGALRALEAGSTTIADSGPSGAGLAAMAEFGLRGVGALEILGRERGAAADRRAAEIEARLEELEAIGSERVRIGLAPHALYSTGPDLWHALARRPGIAERPWMSHLAESPAETELLRNERGPLAELFASLGIDPGRWPGRADQSPVGRLATNRGLDPLDVAAHCVQLEQEDPATLALAGVSVAHCPSSNTYLRCGHAPIDALSRAGVRVGLGTDSPASGGAYDVRLEARAARLAAQRSGATPPSAEELLALATSGGADALGLGDVIGALRPGMRADLLAIAAPDASRAPPDPASAALDPSGRITRVAVDGETLFAESRPTRVERCSVASEADRARSALC